MEWVKKFCLYGNFQIEVGRGKENRKIADLSIYGRSGVFAEAIDCMTAKISGARDTREVDKLSMLSEQVAGPVVVVGMADFYHALLRSFLL